MTIFQKVTFCVKTSVYGYHHLLISINLFLISLDDIIRVERRPLKPITNININKHPLNNSNETSKSFNYNSRLINTSRSTTPCVTTPHSSTFHLTTPYSTHTCFDDTS